MGDLRVRGSPEAIEPRKLANAAAGHAASGTQMMLEEMDEGGNVRTILKPFDEVEFEVYKHIWQSYGCDPIYEVVPRFQGVVEHVDGEGQFGKYCRIQNVLQDFWKPMILDVKLGCRTFLESECKKKTGRPDLYSRMVKMYPSAATPEEHAAKAITKHRWMSVRDAYSTIGTLGYRIDGIAPFNQELSGLITGQSDMDTQAFFEKYVEAVALGPDSDDCFATPGCIARELHQKITRMITTIESSEFVRSHEFIGSSILIVADKFGRVGVWWIDFAKTFPVPQGVEVTHRRAWEPGNHEDGLFQGLSNLAHTWEQVAVRLTQDDSDSETVTLSKLLGGSASSIVSSREPEGPKMAKSYSEGGHNGDPEPRRRRLQRSQFQTLEELPLFNGIPGGSTSSTSWPNDCPRKSQSNPTVRPRSNSVSRSPPARQSQAKAKEVVAPCCLQVLRRLRVFGRRGCSGAALSVIPGDSSSAPSGSSSLTSQTKGSPKVRRRARVALNSKEAMKAKMSAGRTSSKDAVDMLLSLNSFKGVEVGLSRSTRKSLKLNTVFSVSSKSQKSPTSSWNYDDDDISEASDESHNSEADSDADREEPGSRRHSTCSTCSGDSNCGRNQTASNSAGSQPHMPLSPISGCSFFCLLDFMYSDEVANSRDMRTLCTDVIVPATSPPQVPTCMSYAEKCAFGGGIEDSLGQPPVAPATHFVSYASEQTLQDVLEAVGDWIVKVSGTSELGVYLWLDLFSVNQHSSQQEQDSGKWSAELFRLIGDIPNTIVVLDPWDDPLVLRRSWAIWEMYSTLASGSELHFAMRPKTRENFSLALLDSFEQVHKAISQVDVTKSRAYFQSDQDSIFEEIRRCVGFERMNEMIQVKLRQWLTNQIKDRLRDLSEQCGEIFHSHCWVAEPPGNKKIHPNAKNYMRLKGNLAHMLRESGNLEEAEQLYTELQAEQEKLHGIHHPITMRSVNSLAVTLDMLGRHEQAVSLHRANFQRRRRLLGTQQEDTLQSASNLAITLGHMKSLAAEDFQEARQLFKLALEGRKASAGPDHPVTLYTMSQFGRFLSTEEGCVDEAEEYHDRAVSSLRENSQLRTHPTTLTAMHNQGCHWCRRGTSEGRTDLLDKGLEQLNEVWSLRAQTLGRFSPYTQETHNVLLQVHRQPSYASLGSRARLERMPWRRVCLEEFPSVNTATLFQEVRSCLRRFKVDKLRQELVEDEIVDPVTGLLAVCDKPRNYLARVAVGLEVQPGMREAQQLLGPFQDRFVISCHHPACDSSWTPSGDDGEASVSKRHRCLLSKDLEWEWFNVLTFGLVTSLERGIQKLEEMKQAALHWSSQAEGWPSEDRIGLFLMVYSHTNAKICQLHLLDMDHLGSAFPALQLRLLRLDDAIFVLRQELTARLEKE